MSGRGLRPPPAAKARITPPADFLRKSDALHIRMSERAHLKRYRKGQLDPSVWVRAFRSALSSSNAPLAQNESLAILTGGTPEAIVAGIIVGFKRIFVVADGIEHQMMQLPALDSEHLVDYYQCPQACRVCCKTCQPARLSLPACLPTTAVQLNAGTSHLFRSPRVRGSSQPRPSGCWPPSSATPSTARQTLSTWAAWPATMSVTCLPAVACLPVLLQHAW